MSSHPVAPTADEFRHVIGHFTTGVTVVTVRHDGDAFGTTASAVSSVSLAPPSLLVCMNRGSATGRAIDAAGAFAVSILSAHQQEVALRFAMSGGDKFGALELSDGARGHPLLAGAIAHVECVVTERMDSGTHRVFIGEVVAAATAPGEPLAYFRGRFGRLAPSADGG